MEKRSIELHDSKVEDVRVLNENVILIFSEAYIHKSKGRPGYDAGSGWSQRIQMEFLKASLDGQPRGLPDRVSDGELDVGGKKDGLIDLPFEVMRSLRLSLIFQSGNEIQIFGEKMILTELDEAEYVEEFPGSKF
jgi:hypothetical protein